MRHRLSGALAQLAHIRVQDVLLLQVGLALYAVLEEQPGEEFDLRGGMVLQDEAGKCTFVTRQSC